MGFERERRDTPSVEAWSHDQRRCFDTLMAEQIFARVEVPEGWKKEHGKLLFSPPKQLPLSYLAEQVRAPRGGFHLEPNLVPWRGEKTLDEVLQELAGRGNLHPVSFKTLELLTLRSVLLDSGMQRSLILPGVVGRFADHIVHPMIDYLPSEGSIVRRALFFRSPQETQRVAVNRPTALFFSHRKPLRKEHE